MSVRFTTWPTILAIFMFCPSLGWAGSWQQSASAQISSEIDTNPTMSLTNQTDSWRTTFAPGYTLKRTGDANQFSAGLSAQIMRASNKTLIQNRDDPSAFLDWHGQSSTGELGLKVQYDETGTRFAEIDNTGPGYADGTRATRTLSGSWNNALTERSTLALNGAYKDISYTGGTFIDYVTRSGGMRFNYAWSERSTPFIRMSYTDTKPTGSDTLSRFANVLAGWNWKMEDYLDVSLQAGKSKISGADMARQAAAEVKYTGQRYVLALNADRQISASGLGGFVTIDQVKGSWIYTLSERSNAGIETSWSKNRSLAEIINQNAGAWLQFELSSYCVTRAYYQHKTSERGGAGAATSDILGVALVFTHTDF